MFETLYMVCLDQFLLFYISILSSLAFLQCCIVIKLCLNAEHGTSHLSSLHLYVPWDYLHPNSSFASWSPIELWMSTHTSVNHAYGTLCSSHVPFWWTVPYKIWMPVIGLLIEFSIILASFHKGKYDHFSLNVWLQILGFLLFFKG